MFRNGHSFSLFLGKWLWLERPLNSRQGAGILYGLSAMLFQPEGGKKRKKKEPMVFRFNLSYARNLVHEPTYTRAWEGEGGRERGGFFLFLFGFIITLSRR